MKICSRCKIPKQLDDFHVWSHARDGRKSHCKGCESDRNILRYNADPESIKTRVRDWRVANLEHSLSRMNGKKLLARLEALIHYSGPNPSCACCGEPDYRFLTIDHIDGGGSVDRPKAKKYGGLALWLRANGYPSGFQVLCWNCNCGKGVYGVCPHELPPISFPILQLKPPPKRDDLCGHCGEPGEFYPSRPKTCKVCILKYKKDRLSRLRG